MARWERGTKFQSLSFDKAYWDLSAARKWAVENKFKSSRSVDDEYRIVFEQQDVKKFRRTSLRTVQLDEGVQAVVGVPIDAQPRAEQSFGEALAELRADIARGKKTAAEEWRSQKKSVQERVAAVRRARTHGPDPLGDFFRWLKKLG